MYHDSNLPMRDSDENVYSLAYVRIVGIFILCMVGARMLTWGRFYVTPFVVMVFYRFCMDFIKVGDVI